MSDFDHVRPSYVLFVVAGIIIIIGVPTFWTENFYYWAFPRLIYGVGVLLFWFDK